MKLFASALLACAGFVTFAAQACEAPSVVTFPEGKTASLQQMVTAQKAVKEYVAAMNDYMACFDKDLKAAGLNAPDEYKTLMTNRHNFAVDEMEAVAGEFNKQVRAYKAAHAQASTSNNKDSQ